MRLPTRLSHRKKESHKNDFGHVLVFAGSPRMLGAAALAGLACMRSGAGLVTIGVPQSLNLALQKKINNAIMTWPLPEAKNKAISLNALREIKKSFRKYSVISIGPGLGQDPGTQKFIRHIIAVSPVPLVIDADALNALPGHLDLLGKTRTIKILTPHPGEMARLIGKRRDTIERDRIAVAKDFAKKFKCILLLKGHRTVVASPEGKIYINRTGNPGMATAGSGDVLTGMASAFLAQGLDGFEAAKLAAYFHGKAGDLAARARSQAGLIASDIIDFIPKSFLSRKK